MVIIESYLRVSAAWTKGRRHLESGLSLLETLTCCVLWNAQWDLSPFLYRINMVLTVVGIPVFILPIVLIKHLTYIDGIYIHVALEQTYHIRSDTFHIMIIFIYDFT